MVPHKERRMQLTQHMMSRFGIDAKTAEAYLLAEEWVYNEAALSYKADRDNAKKGGKPVDTA